MVPVVGSTTPSDWVINQEVFPMVPVAPDNTQDGSRSLSLGNVKENSAEGLGWTMGEIQGSGMGTVYLGR